MSCPTKAPEAAGRPVAAAPRTRKAALLSQVCEMALAGQSCRKIAEKFGLTKSTVNRWLQDLREDCPTRVAGAAELIAAAIAGYESLYDVALEAFDLSRADKVTKRLVKTETARGRKTTRSVRRENQTGKPAYLTAALRAVDRIVRVADKVAPRGERGRKGEGGKGRKGAGEATQSGLSHLIALPGGETGGIGAEKHGAVTQNCPTGIGPLGGAAEMPRLSQFNSGDQQVESLLNERGSAGPRDGDSSQATKCPIFEKKMEEKKMGEKKMMLEENSAKARNCPTGEKAAKASAGEQGRMGQDIAARLEMELHSPERQRPVLAGFFAVQPRTVMEALPLVLGDTRRKAGEFGCDCPIPAAKLVSRRRGDSRRSRQKSQVAGLQTVPS